MTCLPLNTKQSTELLNNILIDYKVINGYLVNGDLLSILNSASSFNSKNIYALISSLNQYKRNTHNLRVVKEVFIIILNSKFICDTVEPIIKDYFYKTPLEKDIKVILTFFINCFELVPNHSMKTMDLLYPCLFYISQNYSNNDIQLHIENLRFVIENTKRTIESKVIQSVSLSKTTNVESHFKDICIFPKSSEILSSKILHNSVPLGHNYKKCDSNLRYETVNDYLETQFLLLRDNLTTSLRNIISAIRENIFIKPSVKFDESETSLYENVIIEDLYPSEKGLVYRVSFEVSKFEKNFNWENSSRFRNGSLVCFTNNFFDTIYYASFLENCPNNLSKGILLVQFIEDPINEIVVNNKFIMVETKIPKDTYEHILIKLQNVTPESFPFKDNVVFGNTMVVRPPFLESMDVENILSTFNNELDDSEYNAFENGLMNNLSLITGLPGTGKTHVGLKIIKYMVDNYQEKGFGPVLVVCYTHDMLEQFTLDIIKTVGIDNVVRIGDCAKMDLPKKCDISTIKSEWIKKKLFPTYLLNRRIQNENEIDIMEESLTRKFTEITNCNKRILSINVLTTYMSPNHVSFFENTDFENWMKGEDTIFSKEETANRKNNSIKESCVGHVSIVKANLKNVLNKLSNIESLTEEEYNSLDSLDVDFEIRLRTYKYWFEKHKDNLMMEYEFEKENYDNLNKEREQIFLDEYFHLIRNMKVMTMTTSSAITYGAVLDRIDCRIVVVEGAAKVPDCHVLCSLTKDVQQLIMIGDYNPSKTEMCSPQSCDLFNTGMSLLDRLIENNFRHFTLKFQYKRYAENANVSEQCGLKIDCGHICTKISHTNKPSHKDYKCKMNCMKVCARSLHPCKLLCFQSCQCDEKVIFLLPCGHEKELKCHENEKTSLCKEICKEILDCGHQCMMRCCEPCICNENVSKKLRCGHQFDFICGQNILDWKCNKICLKRLNCGHTCKKICLETCVCEESVERTLPCFHKKILKCGNDNISNCCEVLFEKFFPCGHSVKYKCFERSETCNVEVDKIIHCGHKVKLKCSESLGNIVCQYKCEMDLNCQHKCEGTCGQCYLQRFHRKCRFKCKKFLKCGHQCESLCHVGFCPPCIMECKKYCKHSTCSAMCGEICGCKVCLFDCKKPINCVSCKKIEKCSKICGVPCSTLCKRCLFVNTKENNRYYIMEPCNCKVEKMEFKPIFKIEMKEAVFSCQKCYKTLQTPYEGIVLLHYKKEYSSIFQLLSSINVKKWKELLEELFLFSNLPRGDLEEMMIHLKEVKICKEDLDNFDKSYLYYNEILEICKTMSVVNKSTHLERYDAYVKNALTYIIKWLNPFCREFQTYETYIFEVEKSKLKILSIFFSFLNSITIGEYALVHKQCFQILDQLLLIKYNKEVKTIEQKLEEVKKNVKNKKQSTKEEDELVEKIISARDLYREFKIEKLSAEDKLKELKKIIVKCHPDKNNSNRANEAVQKLIENMKMLKNIV